MFSVKEEEGEYHTLFGRLYDNRQKLFKCFKIGISKFENFKELLSIDNQKKNIPTLGDKKRC